MRVAQFDEGELGRGPEDHVLAQAREVDSRQGDVEEELGDEVAVAHRVHAVLRHRGKAELLRDELAVQDDGRSGQRARSERHHVDAAEGVAEALLVALEHLEVGEEVVGEKDRLAALEVGVARHHRGGMVHREGEERVLERGEAVVDRLHLMAAIEADVEGDLVVAAAGGVQLRPGGTDLLGEGPLDVHVDVLEARLEAELARLDLAADLLESLHDGALLRRFVRMPASSRAAACAMEPSMSQA